jgi:hypothetical protein
MKTTFFTLLANCMALYTIAQTTVQPIELQIKTAVQAAPSDKRDAALVYGYGADGAFQVIRPGSNDYVCIADDPKKDGISVSCYHKDLEPFMERGRILAKEGKNQKEIFDIREKEVKAGQLMMPKQPSTLFALAGTKENHDTATGVMKDGYLRYVVYIPYATSESTGLPLKPDVPGMPWIMDPGTHRAHIMINPAKP